MLNWKPLLIIVLGIAVAATAAVYLSHDNAPESAATGTTPATLNAVPGDGRIRGNPQAPLTLTEFGDYQCPTCGFYHPIVSELLKRYPEQVKLEFRHFPLVQIHPFALPAAMVAEAAGEQGHYWEMHDLLYANQQIWTRSRNPETEFLIYAGQLGLNTNQFMQAMKSPDIQQRILKDVERGRDAKIQGTPTFFLNGQEIDPLPHNADDFAKLIDARLAAAK